MKRTIKKSQLAKTPMWENKTHVSKAKISWWYDGIIFLHGIYTIKNKRRRTLFFNFSTDWISVAARQGGSSIDICHQFDFQFLFKKKKPKQQAKGKYQKMTREGKSSSEGKTHLTFSAASCLDCLGLRTGGLLFQELELCLFHLLSQVSLTSWKNSSPC